ncbi:endonuclease/exonuclease/phosphatase family protein [Streptomyces sp. NPDC012389]|uniref:endonuclease/exonuclease/phosphatase family protein n=1 Tax=Streptomyces sp. NPDC012389 TaxID=3364830 RepID=UPI0036E35DCA
MVKWARGDVTAPVAPAFGEGRRGVVVAGVALGVAGVMGLHRVIPNSPGRVGSLVESFLPWGGGVVVLLFVVQHNVSDENPDPAGTARALLVAGGDLVALEEVVTPALAVYEDVLRGDYPHHVVHGTVGLWSKYPIREDQLVDIRPQGFEAGWSRGLRAVVTTPYGDVAAYVAHLPSVRVGVRGLASSSRDESARMLGDLIRREKEQAVILMGDLNSTVDDRGLEPLTSQLNVAERGFAFSYPAALPVARIDQVLARSGRVSHMRTLPATDSDHLPVAARVTLDPLPPSGRPAP